MLIWIIFLNSVSQLKFVEFRYHILLWGFHLPNFLNNLFQSFVVIICFIILLQNCISRFFCYCVHDKSLCINLHACIEEDWWHSCYHDHWIFSLSLKRTMTIELFVYKFDSTCPHVMFLECVWITISHVPLSLFT